MKRARRRGFTLIELLVVIGIIALLAAIGLPNFMEAQMRAKVAGVQSDLRTIATGLEAYMIDYNYYPPSPVALGPGFRLFRPLTTPVAYLTDVPADPFWTHDGHTHHHFRRRAHYGYGAMPLTGASRFLVNSYGPDRQMNTDPIEFYPGNFRGLFMGVDPNYDYMVYDPTNGTISRGDIVRASDYVGED